ncbi:hypothetical protein C1M55_28125 [Rhodococcus qingshengii]|nr:hypothetical protein C1M55_28125 [Rhodococcus qingshengii]
MCNKLEADLQHYYPGRRIAEYWRTMFRGTREMTSRELWVLFDELPEDSRSKAALSGDPWGIDRHLLATVVDTINAHRYDGSEESAPQIERPGRTTAKAQAREMSRRAHDAVMSLLRGDVQLEGLELIETTE